MSPQTQYAFKVTVTTQFMEEQSDLMNGPYVFAYTVTIENTGTTTAQLLTRHWIITDAFAKAQEVRGSGVVGSQPVLKPGERFEYTSACPLSTPMGSMHGSYQCKAEDGHEFEVPIEPFKLNMPRTLH
jgi:ApaG protein